MFTRGQIVDEIQKRGIDFSERSFIYLQEKDMIPKVRSYKGRWGLFPRETLDIVYGIMKAREAGRSRKSIKKGLDIMKGSKEIRRDDDGPMVKMKGWWPVENYLLLSISCPERETISFFLMDGSTIPPENGFQESSDVLFEKTFRYHQFSMRVQTLVDNILYEQGRIAAEEDFVSAIFNDLIEKAL